METKSLKANRMCIEMNFAKNVYDLFIHVYKVTSIMNFIFFSSLWLFDGCIAGSGGKSVRESKRSDN